MVKLLAASYLLLVSESVNAVGTRNCNIVYMLLCFPFRLIMYDLVLTMDRLGFSSGCTGKQNPVFTVMALHGIQHVNKENVNRVQLNVTKTKQIVCGKSDFKIFIIKCQAKTKRQVSDKSFS